jgi:exopolysaccharide biosynthesis polyprenyl glycosylphosphotransferase
VSTAASHSIPVAPPAEPAAWLDLLARAKASPSRRVFVWRALVAADLIGLSLAFAISDSRYGLSANGGHARPSFELAVFFLSLPLWTAIASLNGLYHYDEWRMLHTTVDDFFGVVQTVTLGAWLFFTGCWITSISSPRPAKLIAFWLLATLFVTTARAVARARCHRSPSFRQRTVIVGGGDVGQLVARKLEQHPEYGIELLGLVDDEPRERRVDLGMLHLLGAASDLPRLVGDLSVDRVMIAFSKLSDESTVSVVRPLQDRGVQVDIVPRLYELVGPRVDVHTVEGLPLIGLPPLRPGRAAISVKRSIDVAGAAIGLLLAAPAFAYIAWRVHRSSPGPVFFRQTRLGENMRAFTALKFRTMVVGADENKHREYIETIMSPAAAPRANGVYKLEREDEITPFGRWLRATSLDELPQLWNVLRGEMSLVGPRPCLRYETAFFKPHHFERFLMPAGLTGLWQVTARSRSTFGEALDLDVNYVRGWSLGLDLRLIVLTPFQLLRQRRSTR